MKFNTLDTIIDDILLELRNSNISESESVNRNQIEQWISQYRVMLIKQDIDKGRDVNRQYAQDINNIRLDLVSYNSTGKFRLKSNMKIPKTIDFHFKTGIIVVQDLFGNEIQLMTERRSNLQNSRRYTSKDYTAYMKDDHLYINGPMEIEFVNITGIFEDPYSVTPYSDENSDYPIPVNMIPVIKELIFTKEFKLYLPVDNINNSRNDNENINVKK